MALVNVPIVNSTLVNAQLLEKRKQFIINDCEMLRREFEVYGIELSDAVLDMYRKALIVYNANVVWDLRAVSFRRCIQQTYTNGTNQITYEVPVVYQIPAGILSVDPITLSFMTLNEFKEIAISHINSMYQYKSPLNGNERMPIFDNRTDTMSAFSTIGYAEIETAFQAKYGAFNTGFFTNGAYPNTFVNVPAHQRLYQDSYYQILPYFKERNDIIVKLFQNPTLEMKSLIPEFKKMFSQNIYQTSGIPYNPIYDYEKIHYAAVNNYFAPFITPIPANRYAYTDSRTFLLNKMRGLNTYFGSAISYINMPLKVTPSASEITALNDSYKYPSTDTRSDYQKAFTYSTYTPDSMSVALNSNTIAKEARIVEMNKNFINDHGGHPSIFQTLFWIVAEAHASVMTPVNIMSFDFAKIFKRTLVITSTLYTYRTGGGTQGPITYTDYPNQNSNYGTLTATKTFPVKIYVFLNENFKVTVNGVVQPMWEGMKQVTNATVTVPLDITQPFPYYLVETSNTSFTHLVKTTAFLGVQKLRNGFLYQDIARNFDPTFVNFNDEAIYQLESLASKQVAMYDLLADVKSGTIYTKAITTSEPVQPFNPSMPQYTTVTTYKDVIKTIEGEMPILHPEMEYEIKWGQIHAEMVIQSSFFYYQFMLQAKVTIDDYNNRVGSYIVKLLDEMKLLSTTYVEAEAVKLKAEQEITKMDIALEKLKSGVFINDNGKEYWRPLLPEEQAELNIMIKRIQDNMAIETLNRETEVKNALTQNEVDKAQILANDEAQRLADLKAIELNKQYQLEANAKAIAANLAAQKAADERQALLNQQVIEEDTEWKRINVDNVKAPSLGELHQIARDNGTILSDALIIWENNNPYYSYNHTLYIEVNELRNKIIDVEVHTADKLVEAKIVNANIATAIMELFPDKRNF